MRSIMRSITSTPCGRPAPRTAPVGWRFVYTARSSEWMFGMRYGPGTVHALITGATSAPYMPMSWVKTSRRPSSVPSAVNAISMVWI